MQRRFSIRAQLLALVLCALLPTTALIALRIYSEFKSDYREAGGAALNLARTVGANVTAFLSDSEKLLARIARRPAIRAVDGKECQSEMRAFGEILLFSYLNVVVADRSGQIICSAVTPKQGKLPSAAMRQWFQTTMRTGKFTVGEVQVGSITGQWVVVLAYPVHDKTGRTAGVVGLPLDLTLLESRITPDRLPEKATITILDRQSNIVTRVPEAKKWVGQNVRGKELDEAILSETAGRTIATGLDGVERIYGYSPIPAADWRVSVGFPTAAAFAQPRAAGLRAVWLVLLTLTITAAAAWWISGRISGPIGRLAQDVKALASGDLGHRTDVRSSHEIGELAENFNRMALSIETQANALRENTQRLQTIIEVEPECVKIIAPDGRLIEMNPAGRAMLEAASLEEAQTRPLQDFIVPEYRPAFLELHQRVMRGESGMLEFEAIGLKGTRRWLETHAVPLRGGGQEIVALLGITRDVTARKKAEESLQSRYRELGCLQEISQIVLTTPDIRATAEKTLDTIMSFGGYDIGIIRLLDPRSLVYKATAWRGYRDPAGVRDHFRSGVAGAGGRVMASGKPEIEDYLAPSPRHAVWNKEGVRSAIVIPVLAGDKALGIMRLGRRVPHKTTPEEVSLLQAVGNQLGIAIQKAHANEAIEQSLERIRALREIDQAITSTLELSEILHILLQKIEMLWPFATVRTVRLLLPETGEFSFVVCQGVDEKEWSNSPPGHRSRKVVASKAPLASRNVEADPLTRNPEVFQKYGLVSYLGVPLIVKDDVLGVLSIYTRLEHEFTKEETEFVTSLAGQAALAIHNARIYEEALKANRVKEEFLSVMSHELRTPLSVVTGYVGIIRDRLLGEINAQQEEALQKILARTEEQLAMINDLMQTTALEVAAPKLERQDVDLSELMISLKDSYEFHRTKKNLKLVWDAPASLPHIVTDGTKLKQILQNLIGNAIKFTDQGSVTVSARVLTDGGGEKSIAFVVSDTGRGMPREKLRLIFHKFYQVDSSETRLYGGVGLGLYIAKKFTDLLGGELEVVSEPGKGSTFTVKIPCATDAAAH